MRIVKTFEGFFNGPDDQAEMPHQAPKLDMQQHPAAKIDHDDHHETENYMFFGNLETLKRLIDFMLKMDPLKVDEILKNGHSWAVDHIATSKDDIEEVANFLIGEMNEVDENLVNEADSLELSGTAKRMYNELKHEGKQVSMNYQNEEMGKHGIAKYFSKEIGGKPGDIKIAAFPSHIMVMTDSKEEAQSIIDKYSTGTLIGKLQFWPKNYEWSHDSWSANFSMKKEDQRTSYNPNSRRSEMMPNSNARHREMNNGRLAHAPEEYMATEGKYTCNECGISYEAAVINEGDVCECGGTLNKE